jgi:peptidoglycan/xylan/chitin deacetylase (PgdA/CDA1 family)
MSGPGGAIILLYHRVTHPIRDPQLLCVTPERFAEQINILQGVCPVLPIGEIARRMRQDRPIEKVAAITFDDGYQDNLIVAAPILRAAGAPATIFSTAGPIEKGGEFFWDDLDRILLSPGRLPPHGRLLLPCGNIDADLGAFADYAPDQAEAHRAWDVLRPDDPTPRHRLYRHLCGKLHAMPIAQRAETLKLICTWAGVDGAIRTTHRMMSASELRELASSSLIEIGGHTANHPRLSSESLSGQREEITANRTAIISAMGGAPPGFAYPFGTHNAYSSDTVQIVRELGFEFACANFPRRAGAGTDPFRLPRFVVRNWSGEEFRRQLQGWLEAPIAY